ncbi:MAG: hypothetical protein E7470_02125 [Ruminococcaceae bacterium]|nr:hypothetical protein [Oscillospiraceae bacterium]
MKKVLLKVNVSLCGFLYSIALLFYGYILHRADYVIPNGEEKFIIAPISYLIFMKFAKTLTDDLSSAKTYYIMATITLIFSSYAILAVISWFAGTYRYPVIYAFANIFGSVLIIINYLICGVITHKEEKEKYKL